MSFTPYQQWESEQLKKLGRVKWYWMTRDERDAWTRARVAEYTRQTGKAPDSWEIVYCDARTILPPPRAEKPAPQPQPRHWSEERDSSDEELEPAPF